MPGFVLQLQSQNLDRFARFLIFIFFFFPFFSQSHFLSNYRKVVSLIDFLHQNAMPHNLVLARAPHLSSLETKQIKEQNCLETDAKNNNDAALPQGPLHVTAYIFPRKPVVGARPTTNFSAGACEFAGQLSISSKFLRVIITVLCRFLLFRCAFFRKC